MGRSVNLETEADANSPEGSFALTCFDYLRKQDSRVAMQGRFAGFDIVNLGRRR